MYKVFERLDLELSSLTVYRNLCKHPIVNSFQRLCRAITANDILKAAEHYTNIYSHLIEAGTTDIGKHLVEIMKLEDNTFSRTIDRGFKELVPTSAAKRDFEILSCIPKLSCREIKSELKKIADGRDPDVVDAMPEWKTKTPMDFDELVSSISKNGSGIFSKYRGFIFSEGILTPVPSPDFVHFDDLIGYEWQRKIVKENTKALIDGKPVNNLLLYGDSGTGKSATVKSLFNINGFEALRIIQVEKDSLSKLPELIRNISQRAQKFILFIDDLSFEEVDKSFSSLKVLLEGSLEARPKNTVLYVTSNRRQLVKRRFSDSDELNEQETTQEKTSLADRFGISIPFLSLNRNEYQDMAVRLARRAGSKVDGEALRKEALKWEIEHGSRTPRTARQFADFISAAELF